MLARLRFWLPALCDRRVAATLLFGAGVLLAGCSAPGTVVQRTQPTSPPTPPATAEQIEKEMRYLQQSFLTDACLARLRRTAPELAPPADQGVQPIYALEFPQKADGGASYRLHVTERDRLAYLYTSRGTAGWYTVHGPLPLWKCLHNALPN